LQFWRSNSSADFADISAYGYQFFPYPFLSFQEFIYCVVNLSALSGYTLGLRLTGLGIQIPEVLTFNMAEWVSFLSTSFLPLTYIGGLSFLSLSLMCVAAYSYWKKER
jgi:hypothetical protein